MTNFSCRSSGHEIIHSIPLGDTVAKALSNDLRWRLVKAVERGLSARAAGRKLDISASAATSIIKRWRETGSYEALQIGGYRRCILEPERAFVEKLAREHGDWSEAELAACVRDECGLDVHPTTVGRFIRNLGYRYKKNGIRFRTGPRRRGRSERGLENVAGNL